MEKRRRAPFYTRIGQAGDWSIPKREKTQNRARTNLHTFFTVFHIKLPFCSPALARYSHGSVQGALSPGPWDFGLNPDVSEGCNKCSFSAGSFNTSTWTTFSRFQTMLSHFSLPPLQLFLWSNYFHQSQWTSLHWLISRCRCSALFSVQSTPSG